MKIIICVDENGGMAFGGRRQSRDKVLRGRIIDLAGDAKILVSPYTASLFRENPERVTVCNNPFAEAKDEDFVFAENTAVADYEELADTLIIYKWNRLYPADLFFDTAVEKRGWHLASSFDFKGSSHDKITEEVYMK